MAAAPKPTPKVKREPVAIATAFVTLLSTAMFLAPDVGVDIPDNVAKIVTLVLVVAAGLGIRSRVTPVAAPKLKP